MALTRVGGDLLKKPLNIGAGVTITADGNATFSGIVTAANFVDAAGNPITGGSAGAGLGTAVSAGSTVGGEQIYYTNTVLTVTGDLTIDPPDSSNIAYTQYSEIAVEAGYDLIVEDGDDLIPDILGIGTDQAPVLPGAGGRVRADQFTNKAGTGAPEFPNGATVGSALTVTGNFTVNGSKTYLNSDNVEFKDKNIGIASATTKLTDAQLNGAGFTIYGLNSDKSLTWDNPNDRMAFSTDLYAPNITSGGSVTAETSITVGDTFLKVNQVGLGQTTDTGRNAGVSTAPGTLIYNTTSNQVQAYGPSGWVNIKSLVTSGITATGGITNEYTVGADTYRAHIFNTSGTFTVTDLGSGDFGETVEYLVVAGGGGGGASSGGGGGAGGLRTNLSGHPLQASAFPVSTSPGTYTVTVGAGGRGSNPTSGAGGERGGVGNDSSFGPITSSGGAGGGSRNPVGTYSASYTPGGTGGSGGGHGADTPNGTAGAAGNTPATSPPQGRPGGAASANQPTGGSGGGGAGGDGGTKPASNTKADGGAGVQVVIAGPASGTTGVGDQSPGPGEYQFFAGGGAGGAFPASPNGGVGGVGGGGPGGHVSVGTDGMSGTGGGGGGGSNVPHAGGSGGSGIVIVRYKIGSSQTSGTAKATGGAITFADGRAFHVFNNSGNFTYTDSTPSTLNIVVVAGGGGGGQTGGGNGAGGGAGSYITGSLPAGPGFSAPITIGGGGAGALAAPVIASNGSPTTASFPGHPVIANGGGGADSGSDASANGAAGGSGGGGGGNSPGTSGGTGQNPQPVPASFTYYGNPGGDGSSATDGSAGGGGAGAAGNPGSSVAPRGYGGDGRKETWIPTAFGDAGYFAGGGAGIPAAGGYPSEPGGLGGGGDSRSPTSPGGTTDAQVNTGGGAGGGGSGTTKRTGGSGIVIISYPT